MNTLFQTTWITLLGLSFLFVGGFVLWVYGAQNASEPKPANDGEAAAARNFRADLMQWFYLYGLAAVFFGIGCLLTAGVMIL